MESASGDAKAKSNGAAAAESSASSTGGGGGHRSSSSSNHHHSSHHNSSSAAAVAHAQAQAQAQAAAALGLLDPSALFAHSLFSAGQLPASYNPMAAIPGYGLLGQGGPSPFAPPPSSTSGSSSNNASLNQANAAAQAAWWSIASQMATQDYMARLQQHAAASSSSQGRGGSSSSNNTSNNAFAAAAAAAAAGFPGLSAADNLLASYTSAMNAHAAAHSSGASKSSGGKSRSNPIVRDSLSTRDQQQQQPTASTSSGSAQSGGKAQQQQQHRIPAISDLKFPTPDASSRKNSGGGGGNKSRRRAATTVSTTEPTSLLASGSITSARDSSLSSLSSMAMSYPFFGNPLASMAIPGMPTSAQLANLAAPAAGDGESSSKKQRSGRSTKSERHLNDAAALQLLRLPSSISIQPSTSSSGGGGSSSSAMSHNNNNNNASQSGKARSQTVNGKPLALDVSSLIGKPSTSGSATAVSSSDTDAPLNLSMKTKEDSSASAGGAAGGATGTTGSIGGSNSSRLGRGVSMPKKNTVASLLAQSRNQRSNSPGGHHSSSSGPSPAAPQAHAASNPSSSSSSQHPSSAEMKAIKDNLALYAAMQELTSGKFPASYLNGLGGKDGGASNDSNQQAIAELLRAASLLGGFGFGPGGLAGLTGLSSASSGNSQAQQASGSSARSRSKTESDAMAKASNRDRDHHRDETTMTTNPSKNPFQLSLASSHHENGQSGRSGNGTKSSHDDTLASDESDSMEEDDSMIDSDDGWAGTAEGESRKRSADGGVDSDGRPSKKRRFVSDESALRVPLSLGWKRETLIRAIGKSGVRGEVTYYSPSGRRFRQYPDVVRYLERQGVDNIGRDNFSFSTRCIVGEFIQPLDGAATAGSESPSSGGGQEGSSSQQERGIRLGEPEVRHLVDQIRIARGWKPRSRRMTDEEKEAVGRQREAQRMAQRLEAQEVARQAQEAKLQQRMERERALQEAKEARRQMREQEKLERQEAQRRERELRTQQLVEARKKRQEELDRLREEEQQRKIQELNKQRELFYTAELERERRRQHTAVVKALETRKRYEERERRREELRNEKKLEREKKLEERRKELESWNDQRKPTEDMALTDHKPLPQVPRIENLKLAGQAFADILMLYEFLHTFGETLGFDMDSLPSLDSLQRALLYDSEAEEELLSVMTHLLVCSIEDPGIPHPNRHTTLLGQTLKQADITTTNVSEILRLYLQANGLGDMKLPAADKMSASSAANASTISPAKAAAAAAAAAAVEYPDTEAFIMSEWLKRKPFLSLNPTQKAAILGFMVNELLQNKAVIGQIDDAIEGQNTARRDRWIVDSHIKKLKTLHSRKNRSSFSMSVHSQLQMKSAEQIDLDSTTHDETNHSATGGTAGSKKKADEVAEADEPVADEPEEDSSAEADDNAADQGDEDEDENLPAEELKRKIERLSRQSAQMLTQLALSDLQLRALNMGQDRFRRRLWILPHAGGVYCEALESCEANAGALGTWDGRPAPPIDKPELESEPVQPIKREMISEKEQEGEDNDESVQQQNHKKKSKKKSKKKKEEVEKEEDKVNGEEEGNEPIKSQDVEMQKEVEDEKPLVTFLNGTTKELTESSETNGNATETVVKKEEESAKETEPKLEVKMEVDQTAEDEKPVVVASSDKSEETEAMQVESSLPTLWFNLFPRSSCDHHSLVHATNRDSCSSPTAASEAAGDDRSAPSGKQETVKEEEKIDMLPIPEEMSRGWWRMVDPDQVRVYIEALHPRGVREKELSRILTRFLDFAKESCTKGNPRDLLLKELRNNDNVKMLGGAALPDAEGSWSRETSLRGDLLLLEQIEALEDRVASASMQVKGWKLPARATSEMNLQFRTPGDNEEEGDDKVNPIELAKERLLSVEVAIERRYLKAPLGQNKGDLVQSVLSGSCPSADPPKALLTWREAVRRCETAAQVSMCFYVLETSVAWDKSIMKASCQFCHSGDKEDQLLLCDGCDKGYHTYCFRPPMDNIPDGDWFCYECRNKATGQRNCIVCGKAGSKASSVLCDQCPKAYHIECLQPPLAKVPRGKWLCVLCHAKSPGKKKSSKKSSTASEPKNTGSNRDRVSESDTSTAAAAAAAERSAHLNDTLTEVSSSSFATSPAPPTSATPPSSTAAPSPRRASSATVAQKRSLNQAIAKEKDLAPCRTILDELEAHDEAWPFLTPVNTKQFPTYKKIIRSPMDLSTIRKKMSDGIYKTRDDFCADIQLMFDNCVTFNEDDSPVGKAGHSMKTFFDSRWAEFIAH